MALQFKLVILSIIIALLPACSNIEGKLSNLIVIVDVTTAESDEIPSVDRIMADIEKLVDIESAQNVNNGLVFSVSLFDDISGSAAAQLVLKPMSGNTAMDNPVKRKKEVRNYLKELRAMVTSTLASTQLDRAKSKIYNKLCSTLPNFINTTDENYVIIYSDMLENSELATFYNPALLQTAAKDPIEFYNQKLKPSCELPSLANTEVHLYTAHTKENDMKVSQAEKFWAGVLKNKGAKVKINP